MDVIEHLFRRESGRMIATVTRIFGLHNLALAEDVVQDAFCRALEVWKVRGVPENPAAWLMATAKHRALDTLRRERTARTFASELSNLIESEWTIASTIEESFGPEAMRDAQLRMMFSCCHPRLREEVQVALILHILCGFSVGEIAGAFLSGQAAIEKRVTRGKKVLAGSKQLFKLADADFTPRLSAVHRALYLLFNEGYHGASPESAVRVELCHEAIRLAKMLLLHPFGATPASHALVALLCLHAARLPARTDPSGDLLTLFDQDRSRWDRRLADEGCRMLELAATGTEISEYHVEAMIAAIHARARTTADTDWKSIVKLYDLLLSLRPSPVVALNRAIAISQLAGAEPGLEAIRAIGGRDRLARYPFYWAALAELELRQGHHEDACDHFRAALAHARNPMERRFLQQRIEAARPVA